MLYLHLTTNSGRKAGIRMFDTSVKCIKIAIISRFSPVWTLPQFNVLTLWPWSSTFDFQNISDNSIPMMISGSKFGEVPMTNLSYGNFVKTWTQRMAGRTDGWPGTKVINELPSFTGLTTFTCTVTPCGLYLTTVDGPVITCTHVTLVLPWRLVGVDPSVENTRLWWRRLPLHLCTPGAHTSRGTDTPVLADTIDTRTAIGTRTGSTLIYICGQK